MEVGRLRVEHHRVDVVQKGIAAVEAGSPFHGRADHPDLDVIDRRSLLQTIYLDKTETVVGELRLPGELLIGRRDEAVLALGIAEIVLVDKTVVPESLSIAESDLLSAHSGNLLAGNNPVGQVAVFGNLHCSQNCCSDMSASYKAEGFGCVKELRSRNSSYILST